MPWKAKCTDIFRTKIGMRRDDGTGKIKKKIRTMKRRKKTLSSHGELSHTVGDAF